MKGRREMGQTRREGREGIVREEQRGPMRDGEGLTDGWLAKREP